MIYVFHTPAGWKVCQDYPEKPEYPFCGDIMYKGSYTPCRQDMQCYCRPYFQAVAHSIANAVDVREEDQDWVKRKVFFRGNYFPLPDMEESEQELKDWKPDDNQVYALPDLDVEIKLQGRPKGSKKWMDESNLISPVSNWESRKLAHVFRKKEEPNIKELFPLSEIDQALKQDRLLYSHSYEWRKPNERIRIPPSELIIHRPITVQSPPPDIEESQDDLWTEVAYNFSMVREFKDAYKTLQSKFHLTRVKAELKGEKK